MKSSNLNITVTKTSDQTTRIANISIHILSAGRYYCHLPPGNGLRFFVFAVGSHAVVVKFGGLWLMCGLGLCSLVVTVRIRVRVDVSVRVRVSKLLGSD